MARRGYVKISNDFYMNPKIRELRAVCPSAIGEYMFAISYASDNLTDGRLSERAMLYVLNASSDEINALCSTGLLEPDGDAGYIIHDYLEWQMSRSQIERKRADDRKRKTEKSDSDDFPNTFQSDSARNPSGNATEIGQNTRTQEHKNYSIPDGMEYAPDRKSDSDPIEDHTQSFVQFWSVYPRKQGRRDASIAFAVARRKKQPIYLIAQAQRYASDPNREERFTLSPAKWLNGEHWDDAPEPARSGVGKAATRLRNHLDVARNLRGDNQQPMRLGA